MACSEAERTPRGVWRIVLLVVGLLFLWEQVVFGGPVVRLDHAVQGWVGRASLPVIGPVAQVIADLAYPPFVIFLLLVVVAVVASWRRSWQPVVAGALCVVILAITVLGLKYGVGRLGPAGDGSRLAWPSGHTTTAVVFWGVIARSLSPRWHRVATVVAIVPPALVGIALVLRNYHWTSDVLAGWILGALVLTSGYAATRLLLPKRQHPRTEAPVADYSVPTRANTDQ